MIYEIKTIDFVILRNDELGKKEFQYEQMTAKMRQENSEMLTLSSHFSKGFYFSHSLDLCQSFDKVFKMEFEVRFNLNLMKWLSSSPESKPWMTPIIQGFAKTINLKVDGRFPIRYTLITKIQDTALYKFCEISVITEINQNLTIRSYLTGDVIPDHFHAYFVKIGNMSSKLRIVNLVEAKSAANQKKIMILNDYLKPIAHKNESIRYDVYQKPDELLSDPANILKLDDKFSDLSAIFMSCQFSNFSEDDFRNHQQTIQILLIFGDNLNDKFSVALVYALFGGFKSFLKFLDPKFAEMTLMEFNKISEGNFIHMHSKMLQNMFLALFDSPNNYFSKSWLRLNGVQNKFEEELIDFAEDTSNQSMKTDKKVDLYFGETGNDSNVDLLELNIEKKTNLEITRANTDFLGEPIDYENKSREYQARSISPAPKRTFERQNSTNINPRDRISDLSSNSKPTNRNENNEIQSHNKRTDFYRNKKQLQQIMKNSKGQFSLDVLPINGFKIYLMTWNLAGNNPSKFRTQFKSIAFKIQKQNPDIIYFGFQELFELKMKFKTMMNIINIEDCIKEWLDLFNESLPDYKLCMNENLIALQSFMFIKSSLFSSLLSIVILPIKLGYMNIGNKGAIKVTINFRGYIIEIYNCHLTAGDSFEKSKARVKDLESIFLKSLENDSSNKAHCSFFVGDFNFKLKAEPSQILNVLRETKDPYQILKGIDEYIDIKDLIRPFGNFREEKITFDPTYKYVVGNGKFDGSRAPTWCDRIFFNSKKITNFKVIDYDALRLYISDHTPVYMVAEIMEVLQPADLGSK